MKNRKFISALFTLVAIQALVQAEECCEPGLVAGEPVLCDQIPPIFPYSASVDLDCKRDMYVTGDFIYWTAYSNAAQVGIRNTATGGSRLLYLKDGYRPGFKVGFGIELDELVVEAQYIWWHHRYKTNFSAGPGESITPFTFSAQVLGIAILPGFAQLRTEWRYHFDQLLLSFQRAIYLGSRLSLNGMIGVIADWVKEDTLNLGVNEIVGPAPGVNGFVQGNYKRWSVGPTVGLRAKVLLPCSFRVIGNLDLNIAYLEWKGSGTLSFPPFNPANPFANSTERYKHPVDYWKAGAASQLGLAWERYLCCNAFHVYLGLTYDYITTWSAAVAAFDHIIRFDPVLHGLTLEARFDF
ncbi:MAG: hypothetical protein JSS30_06485 [Verrucomicrobia bacterium]|nr:hypothetical protein [Verrucomicrobiota bacterium]